MSKTKRILSAVMSVLMTISMGVPQMAYAADTGDSNVVTVTAKWTDSNNEDKIRPKDVKFLLLDNINGKAEKSEPDISRASKPDDEKNPGYHVLNADNNWTFTYTVPSNRSIYDYYVVELDPAEGYKVTPINQTDVNHFVLNNVHKVKTSRTIKVAWDDNNNVFGDRPDSIVLTLQSLTGRQGASYTGRDVTVTAKDGWTKTVTGLQKYRDDNDMQLSDFRWVVKSGENYYPYLENGDIIDKGDVSTITFARIYGTLVIGTKFDFYDPKKPVVDMNGKTVPSETITDFDKLPENLKNNIKFTLTYPDGTKKVYALKDFNSLKKALTWIPEGEYTLEESGAELDGYTLDTTYNGLSNKAELSTNEEYKAGENKAYLDFGTQSYRGNAAIEVVNSYHKIDKAPETKNVSGKIVWDDDNDKDGKRPDSVAIHLLADGKDTGKTFTASKNDTSYEFKDVAAKEKDKEIVYSVKEDDINEYTVSYEGMDITNTHIVTPKPLKTETVTPSGKITWADNDNKDGKRPNSVKLTLVADGKDTDKIITVNGGDTSYSFPEVTKKKDGKDIAYSVKEEKVDSYTTTYDGMDITNTYVVPKPETKDVSGKIGWNDDKNKDGKRPDSVTIHLYADGKDTGNAITVSKNDTAYEFKDVAVKDGDKDITYSIKEDDISDYTISYNGMDVTNTHVVTTEKPKPEMITPFGKITWEDDNNKDNKRPDSVKLTLLSDGKDSGETITVNGSDTSYKFPAMPKQKDGKDIVYTVKEETVDGYATNYDGMDITNTYKPAESESISIPVKVVWDDNGNQDGKRPDSVKVQVLSHKGDIAMTISEKDDWTASFDDQKDAKCIVTAGDVKDYTSMVSGDNEHGYVITYKHIPEATKVTVEVKWNDKGFEKERPDKITADITADGERVKTVTISKDDDWKAEENLPKYQNGKEIKYVLVGKDVEKYSLSVKGNTITYTRAAKMIQVSAEVVWKDSDNAAKKRPSSVQIQLYANGQAKGSPVTLKNGAWKHTFASLEAEDGNSKQIVYTVDEVKVPDGYTKSVTNASGKFTITNTYTPVSTDGSQEDAKVNIAGKITWNDQNDTDRIRPKSVTVTLNANGKAVARKIVKAEDNWTFDFGSRDKNDTSGKAITYTITQRTITGYTTTISGYNITNTHTPKGTSTSVTENPVKGSNPTPDTTSTGIAASTNQAVHTNAVQTGDTTNVGLYAILAAAAAGALIILAVRRRKHTDE